MKKKALKYTAKLGKEAIKYIADNVHIECIESGMNARYVCPCCDERVFIHEEEAALTHKPACLLIICKKLAKKL
jgi:hypothetical protein